MTELQKMMPRLLSEHGDNTEIMRAAMANPILALEYIGIKLSKELKTEVERRARFTKESIKKLEKIDKKASAIVGAKIDLSSNSAVTDFLKKEIGDEINLGKKKIKTSKLLTEIRKETFFSAIKTFENLGKKLQIKSKNTSDLSPYAKAHKLIPLLIEKRKVEAAFPQFAKAAVFEKILKEKEVPKSGIRFSKVRFSLQDRSKRKKAQTS